MSSHSVETVLSRAMSDNTFAELLLANPDQALAEYDLTPEELDVLKQISRADVDAFAKASPEERKSFGWQNHNEAGSYLHYFIDKE